MSTTVRIFYVNGNCWTINENTWVEHTVLFYILILIYFFKYETIVRSSASSFGHSDPDPSSVCSTYSFSVNRSSVIKIECVTSYLELSRKSLEKIIIKDALTKGSSKFQTSYFRTRQRLEGMDNFAFFTVYRLNSKTFAEYSLALVHLIPSFLVW